MTQLRGIFAAMCTPFDATGEHINEAAYLAHIDRMIDSGLHGLVLCSGTGEYAYLRPEEKKLLIERGARHVDGRVPTIAQTTALSTAETVELALHAEGCGVSALMVMPPYLEAPGERGILFHYETIARTVAIPVVMYNLPGQTGVDITPSLYRKLIAIDHLDYIKDSTGNFPRLQQLIQVGGGVLSGVDPLAPWALMAGATGMIWGAANFMPRQCVALCNLIAAGKHAEALALWDAMKSIALWLWENDQGVDYLTGVKAATRLSGVDMGPARRPLPPVPAKARAAIGQALSSLPDGPFSAERLAWCERLDTRDAARFDAR
jgi:4-hydroxy-tetrahydrodipicolinate synthase